MYMNLDFPFDELSLIFIKKATEQEVVKQEPKPESPEPDHVESLALLTPKKVEEDKKQPKKSTTDPWNSVITLDKIFSSKLKIPPNLVAPQAPPTPIPSKPPNHLPTPIRTAKNTWIKLRLPSESMSTTEEAPTYFSEATAKLDDFTDEIATDSINLLNSTPETVEKIFQLICEEAKDLKLFDLEKISSRFQLLEKLLSQHQGRRRL